MLDAIVTTVRDGNSVMQETGRMLAKELGTFFVLRKGDSIESLRKKHAAKNIIVITTKGPIVCHLHGEYHFHLSMAELRIKNLNNGKHDHMVEAMGLGQGTTVLDCTLGLATDAIVASYVVGDTGRITGIEASPIISAITRYGLGHHATGVQSIDNALRRIEVVHADYNEFLNEIPDCSFDIVYFDPMFRLPIQSSSSIKSIRPLADERPLSLDSLNKAKRIAKKRVVIKEARGTAEFLRFKVDAIAGGKYSSISYGVIQTGG